MDMTARSSLSRGLAGDALPSVELQQAERRETTGLLSDEQMGVHPG
jgi:hypothetical protein